MGGLESTEMGVRYRHVLELLAEVMDPEMPIGIVDLGMVVSAELDVSNSERIAVDLMPTFLGCSAQMFIENDVKDALRGEGFSDVTVKWTRAESWSPKLISESGRAALKSIGIAVRSGGVESLVCPYCGSDHVHLLAEVGSSLCRSMAYCGACMTPFEYLRELGAGRLRSQAGTDAQPVRLSSRHASRAG
jgi:ring-1,2-phenylacetyl-CoA epoxidase subunit PaaD